MGHGLGVGSRSCVALDKTGKENQATWESRLTSRAINTEVSLMNHRPISRRRRACIKCYLLLFLVTVRIDLRSCAAGVVGAPCSGLFVDTPRHP